MHSPLAFFHLSGVLVECVVKTMSPVGNGCALCVSKTATVSELDNVRDEAGVAVVSISMKTGALEFHLSIWIHLFCRMKELYSLWVVP